MAVRNTVNKNVSETNVVKEVNAAPTGNGKQQFYIEYNPYKNESVFLLNGSAAGGQFNSYCKGYRLQQYVEKRENWEGVIKEVVKKCNTEGTIDLEFKGRDVDFNDLKLALESSGYEDKVKLCHIEAKNDNDMIAEIGKIIENLDHSQIDELNNEKTKNKIRTAYEDAQDAKLKVSVVATMSSGKSTLINSLLEKDILPSQNEACTATVARILDSDNMTQYDCVCKNKNEEEILRKENVQKSDLEEYNLMGKDMANDDPGKIIFMDINGPIPGISAEKMMLLLQDTPGPNNSVDEKHKELTEEMIKNKKNSVILYIMNATQLRVEDDYKLLNIVSTAMKNGGKQARDRFIFVVNKFDQLDLEKEDARKTIEATRSYLGEFGIEQPNIFPVSARAALLLRLEHAGGELTRQERNDLAGYKMDFGDDTFEPAHFEKLADISQSVREKLDKRLEAADDYEKALIHTGIPAIEETINEYLEKYAYPIKVNDAINELASIVSELDMVRSFNEKLVSDKESRDILKAQLEKAEAEQKDAAKKEVEFAKKVDSFSLDERGDNSPKKIKQEVSKKISQLEAEYSESRVSPRTAERKLRMFERSITKMQDEYASKIQFIIENDVKEKGRKIAADYSDAISAVFENIKIEGFDFSSMKEIEKYTITDIDVLVDEYTEVEEQYETRYETVLNPKKRWWRVFTPKYIERSYEVKVGETEYVDIQAMIVEECSSLEDAFSQNVDKAFKDGKAEIEAFKKVFKSNLSALNMKISEVLRENKAKAENIEKLEAEMKANAAKLKEIEELAATIKGLLDF